MSEENKQQSQENEQQPQENEGKEQATIAIANSILSQITLNDVLKLVHGNVLTQARTHVEDLPDEELTKLLSSLEQTGKEEDSGEIKEPAIAT